MKKTLSIVLLVLLVFLAVACSPEHKHVFEKDESKTDIAATCSHTGINYLVCSCGLTKEETVAQLDHDFVFIYGTVTCEDDGYGEYSCSNCGAVVYKFVKASEEFHKWSTDSSKKPEGAIGASPDKDGYWVTVTATCKADGKKARICSVCEKEEEKTYSDKENHVDKTVVSTTAGDCVTKSTTSYKCDTANGGCGATWTEEGNLSADVHKTGVAGTTKSVAKTIFTVDVTEEICGACGKAKGTSSAKGTTYVSAKGFYETQVTNSATKKEFYYLNVSADDTTQTGTVTATLYKRTVTVSDEVTEDKTEEIGVISGDCVADSDLTDYSGREIILTYSSNEGVEGETYYIARVKSIDKKTYAVIETGTTTADLKTEEQLTTKAKTLNLENKKELSWECDYHAHTTLNYGGYCKVVRIESASHFISCEKCGLTFSEPHTSACTVAGCEYSSETYSSVTITLPDSRTDSFLVKGGERLELPKIGESYKIFGSTKTYTVEGWSGASVTEENGRLFVVCGASGANTATTLTLSGK